VKILLIFFSFVLALLISPIIPAAVYAQGLVGPTPGETGSLTAPGEDPFESLRELDRKTEQRYQALFNPTQAALSIIDGVRQKCESANFIGNSCVSLQYESPRIVILEGDKLILDTSNLTGGSSSSSTTGGGGYWPNPFLWQAVDGFKGLGYSVTSVELGGQGSQGNPHDITVVMEK